METKVPLACKKENGQPVLLDRTGSSADGKEPICGNSGKEKADTSKGNPKCSKASATAPRKNSAKTKAGDGNRSVRHGQSYSIRRAIREAKERNRTIGRSAEELGIVWPEDRCDSSPSKAHYFAGQIQVDSGTIFECKHCHQVKWLPNSTNECVDFSRRISDIGTQEAYWYTLDFVPAAKKMLALIQATYYLRKIIKNDNAYLLAVTSIVADKDYLEGNSTAEKLSGGQ